MRQTDIRLIACDMDGTLLNRNGGISPATRSIIQRLTNYQIIFSIASGRMPHRIDKHVVPFVQKQNQYYVASNGAIVICRGKVIFEKRFPVKPYQELILDFAGRGLEFDFDYDDSYRPLFASERTIRFADDVYGYANPIGIGADVWKLKVNKISVMDPLDSGILNEFIQGMKEIGNCTPFQYGIHAAEIVPENCSKWTGLQYLLSHLKITEEQALAIGDHTNDIEMLSCCGASAAVGNAVEEARRTAKYQCQEKYDQGVAEAIQHYLPFI